MDKLSLILLAAVVALVAFVALRPSTVVQAPAANPGGGNTPAGGGSTNLFQDLTNLFASAMSAGQKIFAQTTPKTDGA